MDVKTNDRVRVIRMIDSNPLPAGATGTVQDTAHIFDRLIVSVLWDPPHETRTLNILVPEDTFEIIEE